MLIGSCVTFFEQWIIIKAKPITINQSAIVKKASPLLHLYVVAMG